MAAHCEFEASLRDRVSSRPAWGTECDLVKKKKKMKNEKEKEEEEDEGRKGKNGERKGEGP